MDGTGPIATGPTAPGPAAIPPAPVTRGWDSPQPYRAGVADSSRVPANGSQPRADLGSATDPDVLGAAPTAEDHSLIPASWAAYLPAREMGIRIFIGGLIALAIAIAGLVTVATRRP
jgi:hypothetical protein